MKARPDDELITWSRFATTLYYRKNNPRPGCSRPDQRHNYALVYGVLLHHWALNGKIRWRDRKHESERWLSYETGLDRRTVHRIWRVFKRDGMVKLTEPDDFHGKDGRYRTPEADGDNDHREFYPSTPDDEIYEITEYENVGVTEKRPNGLWDKFPRGILRRRDLCARAKKLFIIICGFRLGPKGRCQERDALFAKILGCTDRAIRHMLGELRERGMIRTEEKFIDGRQTMNVHIPQQVTAWSADPKAISPPIREKIDKTGPLFPEI